MSATKVLTEALLKNIMTDVIADRGYCTSFDQATQGGVFRIDSNSIGNPCGNRYGLLLVLVGEGLATLQIFIPNSMQGIYLRLCWVGAWENWQRVVSSVVT